MISIHCEKRIAIFPSRESLVSDIPAGDRKNDNLFMVSGAGIQFCRNTVQNIYKSTSKPQNSMPLCVFVV